MVQVVEVLGLSGCALGPVAPEQVPSQVPSDERLAAEHTPLGRRAPDELL